jgi:hypothetical protein
MIDHDFPTDSSASRRGHTPDPAVQQPNIGFVLADPSVEIFKATVEVLNAPTELTAGENYWIEIRIRNDSQVTWPSPDIGLPGVVATYHWVSPTGESHHYLGQQTRLTRALQPGETIEMSARVEAPSELGDYLLQWDLLAEDVAWFTTRGWQGPEYLVRVVDDPFRNTEIDDWKALSEKPWDLTFLDWIKRARLEGKDPNDLGDTAWSDDPAFKALEGHYLKYIDDQSVVFGARAGNREGDSPRHWPLSSHDTRRLL